MNVESKNNLAIVFWNPDQSFTRAGTTLHLVEDELDPKTFNLRDGLSISDFFRARRIPIQVVMEAFPDYIVPDEREGGIEFGFSPTLWVREKTRKRKIEELSWDMGLKWQTLPMDEDGLRRLADINRSRVYAFTFFRGQDKYPVLYLTVDTTDQP